MFLISLSEVTHWYSTSGFIDWFELLIWMVLICSPVSCISRDNWKSGNITLGNIKPSGSFKVVGLLTCQLALLRMMFQQKRVKADSLFSPSFGRYIAFFPHILLVKEVINLSRLKEREIKFYLPLGKWQVHTEKEHWDGKCWYLLEIKSVNPEIGEIAKVN